ncbi:hypothetical protein SAMN04488136_105151 [Vibrio xiamenensis]|uniref:Uncharacterized protein n=1 Tax=Vibrio xiamenensis TaxID=861298 RepID=A0A1G7YI71_9VIBR|nr:hypothetical protein [Vibrio xiamenensis]SDG96262.1 hypothetical protein SAMN04488136_105151 [Vibrio xiamenensis]
MKTSKTLSPYKKKKRAGILSNLAICALSYGCIKMEWLSLIPVFTCAISFMMALFHAMYFFFNYDDEEESLEAFFQNEKYITTNRNQMPNKHNQHD